MVQGTDGLERGCRRGRPRRTRRVEHTQLFRCYAPRCTTEGEGESVILLPEELEILKLVELQGLEQEEASAVMGISRRTAWKDLHEARKKVADALVNGKVIEVARCRHRMDGRCPRDTTGPSSEDDPEDVCREHREPREGSA